MASLLSDVRLACRSLARDRGFTCTALFTFTLCLGANVALFAVVNAVLLRPLPFPASEQLVTVYNSYPKAQVERAGSSAPHYLERRAGVAGFASAAAYRSDGATIGAAGTPDRVESMRVTPSFFSVLQVAPALGRAFAEDEGVYGQHQVVILSDALWRQRFAADPAVIGQRLPLAGLDHIVVGVMPRGFRFLSEDAQLWTPLCFSDEDRGTERRHNNNMAMIARLHPGATAAEAQAQIDALNTAALASDPYGKLVLEAGFHTPVAGLHADFVAATRPVLLLLQGGVLFLLLIGVVNLANLQLVRASARARDLSVRQVLGASVGQLARQILVEALVLALAGAVGGLALGWVGVRSLTVWGADQLPRATELSLDGVVVVVALAAATLLGGLLALPVIWQMRRAHLAAALASESRGGTTTRAAHRLRHTLIVAQFALAFVLLAGAGLLGLSFARVLEVDPGFRRDHLLTGTIPLPWDNYQKDEQRLAFVQRLTQELASLPGLTATGFTSTIPFTNSGDINAVFIEGRAPVAGEAVQAHFTSGVTGDFFAALGIPLREGRLIGADDTTRGERVCVVDEEVARRYWPDQSALGRRLFLGPPDDKAQPFTVVGVVGAIKQRDLSDREAKGAIYFAYAHYAALHVSVVLRTAQPPETAAGALRAAVLRVDPGLPVADLKSMDTRIEESLEVRRSPLLLAGLLAGVALLLAAVGLYGVLAYAVAQRRREIGVRMALGAQPGQIRAQFLGLGVRLVIAGAVLGGIGAWFASRAMTSLLFEVPAADPLVFGGTAAVLATTALAACLWPAVRAARVPPMEALRGD